MMETLKGRPSFHADQAAHFLSPVYWFGWERVARGEGYMAVKKKKKKRFKARRIYLYGAFIQVKCALRKRLLDKIFH